MQDLTPELRMEPNTLTASLVYLGLTTMVVLLFNLYRSRPKVKSIYRHLQSAEISQDFLPYQTPPRVSERVWKGLESTLLENEQKDVAFFPKDSVITIRIIIRNYKSLMKYNPQEDIGSVLVAGATRLAEHFLASHTYIQQGEITLMIPGATYENSHLYGGCRNKIIANTSALLTARLIAEGLFPRLDIKLGKWPNRKQAFQLILQRAYIGQRNGIKRVVGKRSDDLSGYEQIKNRFDKGVLPIGHDAYGTLLKQETIIHRFRNSHTGKMHRVRRFSYESSSDNLLNNWESYFSC